VADPGGRCDADPASLSAGYEALRAAVVSGQPDGWRYGHGVVCREGLAGWMATWTAVNSLPTAGTTTSGLSQLHNPTPFNPDRSIAVLSSLPVPGEIVAVLAQMALAHL
jgi:hypothetical protein